MKDESFYNKELEAYEFVVKNKLQGSLTLLEGFTFCLSGRELGCLVFKEVGDSFTMNSRISSGDELLLLLEDAHNFLTQFHKLNKLHRDVKPKNFIKYNEHYILIDFECTGDIGDSMCEKYSPEVFYSPCCGTVDEDWAALILTVYMFAKGRRAMGSQSTKIEQFLTMLELDFNITPPAWLKHIISRLISK